MPGRGVRPSLGDMETQPGNYSPSDADQLLDDLNRKQRTGGRRFKAFWHEVGTLGRLVRAWKRGEYPLATPQVAMLLGTLAYVVSPIDAVPDMLPIVGLTDDAVLVTATLAALAVELVAFRAWENEQRDPGWP